MGSGGRKIARILNIGLLIPGALLAFAGMPDNNQAAGEPGPCEGGPIGSDPEADTDLDSVVDVEEGTVDSDGDGFVDACDPDDDSDELPTIMEESIDIDGDGVSDPDLDMDGHPNRLDLDSDGDYVSDFDEWLSDLDDDGLPDFADTDSQSLREDHEETTTPPPGEDATTSTPEPAETTAGTDDETPGTATPATETPIGTPIPPAGDDDDDEDGASADGTPGGASPEDPSPAAEEFEEADGASMPVAVPERYIGGGGCSLGGRAIPAQGWLVWFLAGLWFLRFGRRR